MDNATRRQLLEQARQVGYTGSILDVFHNPQVLDQFVQEQQQIQQQPQQPQQQMQVEMPTPPATTPNYKVAQPRQSEAQPLVMSNTEVPIQIRKDGGVLYDKGGPKDPPKKQREVVFTDPKEFKIANQAYRDSSDVYDLSQKVRVNPHNLPEIDKNTFNALNEKNRNLDPKIWAFDKVQYEEDKKKNNIKNFKDYMYEYPNFNNYQSLETYKKHGENLRKISPQYAKNNPIKKETPDKIVKLKNEIERIYPTYEGEIVDEGWYTDVYPNGTSKTYFNNELEGIDAPNIKPIGHKYYGKDEPEVYNKFNLSSSSTGWYNSGEKPKFKNISNESYEDYQIPTDVFAVYKKPETKPVFQKTKPVLQEALQRIEPLPIQKLSITQPQLEKYNLNLNSTTSPRTRDVYQSDYTMKTGQRLTGRMYYDNDLKKWQSKPIDQEELDYYNDKNRIDSMKESVETPTLKKSPGVMKFDKGGPKDKGWKEYKTGTNQSFYLDPRFKDQRYYVDEKGNTFQPNQNSMIYDVASNTWESPTLESTLEIRPKYRYEKRPGALGSFETVRIDDDNNTSEIISPNPMETRREQEAFVNSFNPAGLAFQGVSNMAQGNIAQGALETAFSIPVVGQAAGKILGAPFKFIGNEIVQTYSPAIKEIGKTIGKQTDNLTSNVNFSKYLNQTKPNSNFNLEELRRIYHNSERFLSPEESKFLRRHGIGNSQQYASQSGGWIPITLENGTQGAINLRRSSNLPGVDLGGPVIPTNKSGLTKDAVLAKVSAKDKDIVSKMSESEFRNTVVKPNGDVVPYNEDVDLMPHFTGSNSVNAILPRQYAEQFNENLDLLNKIIAERNKSGVEYRVKGLSENGTLTFYTPEQAIPVKLTAKQQANVDWFTRDPKDWLINKAGLKQKGDKWVMSEEAGGDTFNSIEEAIEFTRNEMRPLTEPKIISGESSWGVNINPGQWRGSVEDIANQKYLRSIPGLEMRNTTSGIFSDGVPRRGSGAYEAINEYLKRLDLGRVKPGFNSQTDHSRGAWESFINSGRAVGYYGNPYTVYGTMKAVTPAIGAGYLGSELYQQQKEQQPKREKGFVSFKTGGKKCYTCNQSKLQVLYNKRNYKK